MKATASTQPLINSGGQSMSGVTQFAPLIGRILVAAIFLWSGIGKIGGFAGTLGYMQSKGVPMAEIALVVTILVEIGAALMLIVGWKARLGAAALLIWMIPVTLVFHAFWAVPPDQVQMQTIQFFKNLGLMGAMLLIVGFGSGPYSLDTRR
ncbi:DoxX family protein [Sulfurifustis variabilis]|uniref:DoxX family protein n=2 Tax=Sulfurifustis variabilis TaxID=1675686 RepID=A0A1B4V340_9GAMM|nr:DoxX family protein [Sulfurifustis variabilis]